MGNSRDCTFQGCGQSLLMKDGSLTLDGCSLADFTSDAIQVDGEARLTLRGCTISGARDGIAVRKNAVVSIENSVITNCARDGLHVEVTSDVVSLDGIPVDDCGCSGSSSRAMKQQAYDLLIHTYPADPVYQQILSISASKIASSLANSLWRDEWHLALSGGTSVYDRSREAVEALFAAYSDDVEFEIVEGELVVKRPFKAEVTVLGAEITSGYNVPVTTQIQVGSTDLSALGPVHQPDNGQRQRRSQSAGVLQLRDVSRNRSDFGLRSILAESQKQLQRIVGQSLVRVHDREFEQRVAQRGRAANRLPGAQLCCSGRSERRFHLPPAVRQQRRTDLLGPKPGHFPL